MLHTQHNKGGFALAYWVASFAAFVWLTVTLALNRDPYQECAFLWRWTSDPVLQVLIGGVVLLLAVVLIPGILAVGIFLALALAALGISATLLYYLIVGLVALFNASLTGAILSTAITVGLLYFFYRKAPQWISYGRARRSRVFSSSVGTDCHSDSDWSRSETVPANQGRAKSATNMNEYREGYEAGAAAGPVSQFSTALSTIFSHPDYGKGVKDGILHRDFDPDQDATERSILISYSLTFLPTRVTSSFQVFVPKTTSPHQLRVPSTQAITKSANES